MGIGDELMAAGQARRLHEADPQKRKVRILDAAGAPRWHELWRDNPSIAQRGESGDLLEVVNGPNARPYIAAKDYRRWTWKEFEPTPAVISFTEAEWDFGAQYKKLVIIQPTIKAKASPNKHWGEGRWREFAQQAKLDGIRLVQLGPAGTTPLRGVNLISTPSFNHACAVLARAKAYVGHEGGMHHAAAALGVPAVVIFGAFISPRSTGYVAHRNLFEGRDLGCGMRWPCPCCAVAMSKIQSARVLAELKELL